MIQNLNFNAKKINFIQTLNLTLGFHCLQILKNFEWIQKMFHDYLVQGF